MAYSALEVMQKANHIFDTNDLSLTTQMTAALVWALECLVVLWFVISGFDGLQQLGRWF